MRIVGSGGGEKCKRLEERNIQKEKERVGHGGDVGDEKLRVEVQRRMKIREKKSRTCEHGLGSRSIKRRGSTYDQGKDVTK